MSDSFNLDVDILEAIEFIEDLHSSVAIEVNKQTKKTAFKIKAEAIKSISASPSQGVTRKLYNSKLDGGGVRAVHTASKAGDAPNTDTGNLVQSLRFRKKANTDDVLHEFKVGSPLDYAAWLEFGTLDMAPRPFLTLALKKIEPDHVERVTKAVREGIKNAEQ